MLHDELLTTLTVIDGVDSFAPATAETFDVDFAPAVGDELIAVADGTLVMDGASIDYVIGDGPLTLAGKLAAATYDNYTAVDNGDGSVTFTANETGAVTPGDPTAFLTQIDTDNPNLLADFGNAGPQDPAAIDTYFGVQASWNDGTDGTGEEIEVPAGPGSGLDMIDFTDYDADAVTVDGVEVEVRALEDDEVEVIVDRVVELTSVVDDVSGDTHYNVSLIDSDVTIGLIAVIDFNGVDQGDFTPDTFII